MVNRQILRSLIFCLSAGLLAACADQGATTLDDADNEKPAETASEVSFPQDGETYFMAPAEQVFIKMELPDGITSSTALWLPVDGSLDPVMQINRSFRTLEDGVYFTEHEFTGAEPGSTTVLFATIDNGKIVHTERKAITFTVE